MFGCLSSVASKVPDLGLATLQLPKQPLNSCALYQKDTAQLIIKRLSLQACDADQARGRSMRHHYQETPHEGEVDYDDDYHSHSHSHLWASLRQRPLL